MLNRLGEFIIDGGWPIIWEFARVLIIGLVAFTFIGVMAAFVGRVVV